MASPTRPIAVALARARYSPPLRSRLVRQNLVLFVGGLVSGVGSFAYHALAGRGLGPPAYGEVASLVALYAVGTTVSLVLVLVLAQHSGRLAAAGSAGAIKQVVLDTSRAMAAPAIACCVVAIATAAWAAGFLKLASPMSLAWVGAAVAIGWYVGIARGVLQGTQRFLSLSTNLGLELGIRTVFLAGALVLGLSVTGAAIAILAGVLFACGLGLVSMRDLFSLPPEREPRRAPSGFAATATVGILAIILLSNLDVLLAKHYLDPRAAGVYSALNKIGTVVYFLTVSVSQVLFARVVEAVERRRHPGRLLLVSIALVALLGAGALGIFGLFSGLVVRVLFGLAFAGAAPYVLTVGVAGLALSFGNLLVQFLLAMQDRAFVPILLAGCVLEALLIAVFHAGVGQVVTDVLCAQVVLLIALALRSGALLLRLPSSSPLAKASSAGLPEFEG
jgi:O-antigen/teichoic acid export membrane protein